MFYNVALICGPNLSSAIPPVWAGFDEDYVVEEVTKYAIMDSSKRTFWRNLWARYYKWKFKDDWEILQKHINDVKLETQ